MHLSLILLLVVVSDNTLPPVGWVVSSETCPFYSIGAEVIREVLPGNLPTSILFISQLA